ncbi:hypothetical protein [Kordiimonas aestuarii]|uniref:hypothetical protein n=1 Tax=Kordiimonas aestuarii TaxID=1005925 RepID=UPI0021D29983|nr:hypothetical protein [Kordiimonas aestuarii]
MFIEQERTRRLFGSDNTLGLFVALYLILLAFFIVLTSVSQHAASRAAVAMESVNSTFEPQTDNRRRNIDPRATADPSNDVALQAVQRAFYAEFSIEGRFANHGGNVFEVEFPQEYLFMPGSFNVRPDMHGFLDQLLAAQSQGFSNKRQEIAFMFGSGVGAVAAEMTRSQEIAVRRAGALARYLKNKGVPDGAFITGFVGIEEGKILAVFRNTSEIGVVSSLGERGN